MSLLKLFAGSSQKKAVPPPEETIKELRGTLETLQKREEYLEMKIAKEIQTAKQLATKNRRMALMALKRKKAYEAQIEKLVAAMTTIETQILSIEAASTNLFALKSMEHGARALRILNKNMSVEQVEDTMEEIREQMEISEEIGSAISQPIGNDIDDAQLEDELNQLVEEDLNAQFDGVNVPTGDLRVPSKPVVAQEEDEFNNLESEMGMV